MMKLEDRDHVTFADLFTPVKTALMRYWTVCWAPALAVFALVLVLSLSLPDFFESHVLIFIQPQKVSTKIVESPNPEDQREHLEALIQEILSRPRLLALIDQFNLYPSLRGVVGKEHALGKLKEKIKITPVTSQTGKLLLQTFQLEFSHEDPKMAYEVVKSLANLFIEESIISKRSEAQGTEEFLEAQLREAKTKLEQMEQQVSEFERANLGRLPEHLEHGVARLQNAQAQLATNSQLLTANLARLAKLNEELGLALKQRPAASDNDSSGGGEDPYSALEQLESALVVLRSRYSEQHPDVQMTKRRIDSLRAKLASEPKGKSGSGSGSRDTSYVRSIRRDIDETEVQLTRLREENKHLKDTIDRLEGDIAEMPLKQQELIQIRRDYKNVKESYERLLAAREDASIQTSLVRAQKSAQFRIVEPASVPVIPAGPPRLIIAAAGLFVAIAVFFSLPLALYFLNNSYKSRSEIEDELGISVLGLIPPIDTPRSREVSRRAFATSVCASGFAVVGGMVVIVLLV